jgi:hypothetical protein
VQASQNRGLNRWGIVLPPGCRSGLQAPYGAVLHLLALKLFLVPGFLALISLAGKRWGPGVAGRLAGLPVVTGPILFFLALERGSAFAASAAAASLSGSSAIVAFIVAYSVACARVGWMLSLLAAIGAWFATAVLLSQFDPLPFVSLPVALLTLLIARRILPVGDAGATGRASSVDGLRRQELAFRLVAGALLTLLVTASAAGLGATWSGLLAVFPVMATILAVFTHRASGPVVAAVLLSAMMSGLYAFVAFTFMTALLLPQLGIGPAFVAAIAAASCAQWLARALPRLLLRWSSARG